ncbi:MAG: hypothetical protein JRG74_16200 [Deltaproteobacteria bacterium]|nr:hypothetical protein [Deltaproteobacteria bacterium]
MDIKEAVGSVLKELIVPELNKIKDESKEVKTTLVLTNKRLDDINLHLADQSRRIDSVREELSERIDETNKRIDSVREELSERIDETNKRIDSVREDLGGKIDETNKRIDRLYEVIVRRDEHSMLDRRVAKLEQEIDDLKRMAA